MIYAARAMIPATIDAVLPPRIAVMMLAIRLRHATITISLRIVEPFSDISLLSKASASFMIPEMIMIITNIDIKELTELQMLLTTGKLVVNDKAPEAIS